jgi:hypothetical protein
MFRHVNLAGSRSCQAAPYLTNFSQMVQYFPSGGVGVRFNYIGDGIVSCTRWAVNGGRRLAGHVS